MKKEPLRVYGLFIVKNTLLYSLTLKSYAGARSRKSGVSIAPDFFRFCSLQGEGNSWSNYFIILRILSLKKKLKINEKKGNKGCPHSTVELFKIFLVPHTIFELFIISHFHFELFHLVIQGVWKVTTPFFGHWALFLKISQKLPKMGSKDIK